MTPTARARFDHMIMPRLDEGYRLARWLTGSATDAEDVMQEASLKAYRAIETFSEGHARARFLKIVRNTCYSWMQSNRVRGMVLSTDLGPADQALLEQSASGTDGDQTPESVLIAKEDAGRLAAAIDALPVPLKEVLVLREHHGMTYREIADISNIPLGTVMSRLARARQHLMLAVGALAQ